MVKVLIFNDPHIRGTSPLSRKDNFPDTLEKKFLEILNIATQEKVNAIVITGDLFDRPDTRYSVIRRFGKLLSTSKVPIYSVIGNHDVFAYNQNTLQRTALGILEGLGVVTLLKQNESIFLESEDIKLQITGTSYHHQIDKREPDLDYHSKKDTSSNYLLHVVHGNLLPKNPIEGMSHTLIEDVKTEADVTASGHYHYGYNLIKREDGKYFLNRGSISRVNASLAELKRKVLVSVVEFDKEITFKDIELKSAQKGEDVLDRTHIEIKKQNEVKLEGFHSEIQKVGKINRLSIDEIINHFVDEEDISTDVKENSLKMIGLAQEAVKKIEFFMQNNLKKLTIENFQSHRYSEIEFSENGFNVIIGETDSGKTAIFRALYYLFFNKYQGDWFISTGETGCCITAELSDGSIISRIKTPSKNQYISIINGEKEIYEGFRNKIPEEIVKLHGLQYLYLDETVKISLNISEQLDSHAILNLTPGYKAKLLGVLSGVEEVDEALRINGTYITKKDASIQSCKSDISRLENDLSQYENLSDIKEKIDNIDVKLNKLKHLQTKINNIYKIKYNFEENEKEIVITKHKLEKLKILPKLKFNCSVLENKSYRVTSLSKLSSQFTNINNSMSKCTLILDKTNKLGATRDKISALKEKALNVKKITKLSEVNRKIDVEIDRNNNVLKKTINVFELKKKQDVLDKKIEKIKRLKSLKLRVDRFKMEIVKVKTIISKTENIKELSKKVIQIEESNLKILRMIELRNKVHSYKLEYGKVKSILSKTKKTLELKKNLDRMEILLLKINKFKVLYDQKKVNDKQIKDNEKTINDNLLKLENYLDKYKGLLVELETCPVCESKINYEIANKIIKEIKQEVYNR